MIATAKMNFTKAARSLRYLEWDIVVLLDSFFDLRLRRFDLLWTLWRRKPLLPLSLRTPKDAAHRFEQI
jgi:hypothetical protein